MPAYSMADYMNLPAPDTVWVWGGVLPVAGSMLLFADPKLGKSKLALSLAEAICDPNIDSFLGLEIQTHGRVLYVQLDTPRNVWKLNYLSCIKSTFAPDNLFMIDREMPDLPMSFDVRQPRHREWLRLEIERIKPVCVIFDTARKMHGADENDGTEMTEVYNAFIEITKNCALIIIAHKKKTQQGDTGDGTVRGSSALTGAVDALVSMSKKALKIQARSDAPEEIPIYQRDDGTWACNLRDEEIRDFITSVKGRTTRSREVDEIVAREFRVTDRTARKWRLSENN